MMISKVFHVRHLRLDTHNNNRDASRVYALCQFVQMPLYAWGCVILSLTSAACRVDIPKGPPVMDIEYLLWLQGIREASPAIVQALFRFLGSSAAAAVALVVPCVAYWCLDKRKSWLALISYGASLMVNQLIKATACVYRPWVRDPRIVPEPSAIDAASGYSFPSAHTQSSTSMLVALGWQWRDRTWPLVLGLVFTFLVAFSRNFLGVHAPQDVIVGFVEACLVIWLVSRLLAWVEAGEGRDLVVLAWGAALVAAGLVYVTLKPYPAEYIGGKLLVDPFEMIEDCYKSAGVVLGVLVGWVIERRFIGFSTDGMDLRRGVLRLIVGGALLGLAYGPVGHAFVSLLGAYPGQLVRHLLVFLTVTALAPAAFVAVEGRALRGAS